MAIELKKGMCILFQGDSITDAGRGAPPGLGTGYVQIAAGILLCRAPDLSLTVINRGISGNRVKDLVGRCFRTILEQTREALGAKIVIVEPFVLPCPADRAQWREDLDPKIAAVRRLAREFADVYVPLDGLFAEACVRVAPEYWAGDGVHPTGPGHAFIALEWLKAVTGFGA
ncbi:MAG: SGNH/GDSL hydrolase family protein [Planctomycetota bacterium]|jgi:lysophospholipase L1-like esterase